MILSIKKLVFIKAQQCFKQLLKFIMIMLFGFSSSNCFACALPVKIPVVKQVGTITGSLSVCAEAQSTYALPQWPSTIFTWSVDNANATLLYSNQSNQIVLQALTTGTVVLTCNYVNTLIGCRGTASMTIEIKSAISIDGAPTVCANENVIIKILDESNNPVNNFDWVVSGPNGFQTTGTGAIISTSFAQLGTYLVANAGNSSSFCTQPFTFTVINSPAAPTAITGQLTNVCAGLTLKYSVPPVTGATIHWEVDNGFIIGSSIGTEISVLWPIGLSFGGLLNPYKLGFGMKIQLAQPLNMSVLLPEIFLKTK